MVLRARKLSGAFEKRSPGMHSRPPVAALLLVLTKRSPAPWHRMPEEILRMFKVIADVAQRGGIELQ